MTQTAIARFMNVRAPQSAQDAGIDTLSVVVPPKDFKSGLIEAIAAGRLTDREGVQTAARAILAKTKFDMTARPVTDAVRQALMARGVTAKAASDAMAAQLGKAPKAMLSEEAYRKLWHATWEVFYARTVLGMERRAVSETLRAADVLARVAAMSGSDRPGTWSDALARRVLVPKSLFQPPKPKAPKSDPATQGLLDMVKDLHREWGVIEALKDKIMLEDRRYYRIGEGAKPRTEIRFVGEPVKSSAGSLRAFRVDTAPLPNLPKPERGKPETDLALDESEMTTEPANWLRQELDKEPAKSVFSQAEQRYLKQFDHLTVQETERNAMDAIVADHYRRARDLLLNPRMALPAEVTTAPETRALVKALKLPATQMKSKGKMAAAAPAPGTARVHVLGIGDLIVVEEQIARYALGEVAHIENVMAKETRTRTHLRISETETTQVSETEETAVDEKSLQTTDRFELSKETQAQLDTSLEVTAGASMSAGYGPVSVSANAGITSSTSASSGRSTASQLAREAVEKAVSSVTKRVREEQTVRVLNRIEETNEHGFTNDTDKNLTGIYRWVDKFYTVRAVNYGRRLMLEMIVPEPANGFIYAQEMHADEGPAPVAPPPLTFEPSEITRNNYLDYAAIHGATDVPPPPPSVIHQTLTYGGTGDGGTKFFAESGKTITIPEGYVTTNAYRNSRVIYNGSYISEHTAGSKRYPGDDSVLSGVTGSLQVSSLVKAIAFHIGWKVRCELQDSAYEAWQVAVWAAIKSARDAAQADYEERVAAAAIGRGVHIEGHNPDFNAVLIRQELQRAAIKYLSDDMGELIVNGTTRTNEIFNAADDTGDFDLEEARIEGQIIQFFEQAFEWHNMTWLFYPYFWAKSAQQHKKMLAEDNDPKMQAFLSAGAARVVVPVPQDYEDAVLNFFGTNEIWNGGEPPLIDDAHYISIAEELKQGRTNSFNSPIYYEGAGTPPPFIVDEWEVKLPTSLVLLQPDGTLPSFPAGLYETDAAALLDAAVLATGTGQNWRTTIVDLLTLFGVTNATDPAVRRSFAANQGYPGDPDADALASVDGWSYFHVLNEINLNGLP